MTIQPLVPSEGKNYPRRGDRMQEEPSAKNAQGMFSPDACVFVGNLSTKVPSEQLAEDLKEVFSQFGSCHVKIKQDKKKNLPGAFVQFERVEDANAALECDQRTELHDRWLRVEKAKGRRTALLGLRSGVALTEQDLLSALEGRGVLEAYYIEPHPSGFNSFTHVGKVTFAYVDDCRDAIRHFSKDQTYYLSLLDMDGSPLKSGPGSVSDQPGTKPYNSHQSYRSNHSQRGGHTHHGGHRNGPPRGGYRGSPRYRHPNYYQRENIKDFRTRGGYDNVHRCGEYHNGPNMGHGMPYGDHHSFYHHPPSNNAFAPPPFIVNSQPMYGSPHSHGLPHPPPGTFGPHVNNGPFIVGGQPMYSPHLPACWGEPYQQSNEYYSPPFHVPHYPDGYFNGYNQHGHQNMTHLTVPYNSNKATPPPGTIVTGKVHDGSTTSAETATDDNSDQKSQSNESFQPEGDTETEAETGSNTETKVETDEDLFNLKDRERPRLIRIHDSGSDYEASDSDQDISTSGSETEPKSNPGPESESKLKPKADPANSSRSTPALAPVVEEEVDEDYTTPEPSSESDTIPERMFDKGKEKTQQTDNNGDESPDLSDSFSNSSSQTCLHKPLNEQYQLRTGKTIGEYIRNGVEALQNEYPQELMDIVAREIVEEEEEKNRRRIEQWRQEQENAGGLVVQSGSMSQTGSIARSLSTKSA